MDFCAARKGLTVEHKNDKKVKNALSSRIDCRYQGMKEKDIRTLF